MNNYSLLYAEESQQVKLIYNSELIEDLQINLVSEFLFPNKKAIKNPEEFLDLLCTDSRDIVFRQQIISDLFNNTSLIDVFKLIEKLLEQLKLLQDEYIGRKEEWIKLDILYRLLTKYAECVDILIDTFMVNVGIKSKGLLEFKNWIIKKYSQEDLFELEVALSEVKEKYKDIKGLIVGINVDEYYVPQALTIEKLICEDFSLNGVPISLNSRDGLSSINSLSGLANQKDFQILGAFLNEKLRKILKEQTNLIRTKLSPFTNINVEELASQYIAIVYYLSAVKWYSYFSAMNMVMIQPKDNKNKFLFHVKECYSPLLAMKISSVEISSNDIELSKNNYVVTGANSAGKTTMLRTIALNQILFSAGLHICAKEAELSVSNSIFTFFSTGETIEDSRFAMEVVRLGNIINYVTNNGIVFLNEPLSSTNPEEGIKICGNMIKRLSDKGATVVTVTHYYELYDLLKVENSCVVSLMMKNVEINKNVPLKDDTNKDTNLDTLHKTKQKYILVMQEPDGINYAKEIAEQFGFGFDLILNKHHKNSYDERYTALKEVKL